MWKWLRREKKLKARKEAIPKHGKGLAAMYRDAILKRLRKGNDEQS